jgi:hypothetical protein
MDKLSPKNRVKGGMVGSTAPGESWVTLYRPGYSGGAKKQIDTERRELYGNDSWRTAFRWIQQTITYNDALQHYEDAYVAFFEANPDELQWLLATASNVYDNSIQEAATTHLQDIAIRRSVMRLGQQFKGDHWVEIRGYRSEGYRLNPGQVPFHRPELICRPAPKSWWRPDSVEGFWQANKVFQVKERVFSSGLRLVVHLAIPTESGDLYCETSDDRLSSLPFFEFSNGRGFQVAVQHWLCGQGVSAEQVAPTLAAPRALDGAVHVLWAARYPTGVTLDGFRDAALQNVRSARLVQPVNALIKEALKRGTGSFV